MGPKGVFQKQWVPATKLKPEGVSSKSPWKNSGKGQHVQSFPTVDIYDLSVRAHSSTDGPSEDPQDS